MAMTTFLLDNLPSGPALAAALGATTLEVDTDPATLPETLWRDDARLLVLVNLGGSSGGELELVGQTCFGLRGS